MEFEKRQGVVVHLYSLKHVRQLRKFGNIHYISKRMKYVLLYSAQENVENLLVQINRLNFVKRVEPSYKPFVNMDYEKGKSEHEKEIEVEKHYGM